MAQVKTWVTGYGCTSSAGPSTTDYWDALCRGTDQSRPIPTTAWPVPLTFAPRACLWNQGNGHATDLLTQLLQAWKQALLMCGTATAKNIGSGESLGVIFASTKGGVEDFVWEKTLARDQLDPITPVLRGFLKQAELKPKRSICVSNACASSLSAMFLARIWLAQGDVSHVLVLAADRVGPFVVQGFHALRALTADRARPFDRERDGLQLGEAAAAVLLSSQPRTAQSVQLEAVGLDAEGFAATRPSLSGESLGRACLQIPGLREVPPDLIIAHGTSTVLNDQTEDHVLAQLFEASSVKPAITGTKWCIGHTLGASGAMDVIAACRVLETQKFFRLANTREVDASFRGHYLTARQDSNWEESKRSVTRVLVTSLGFGGVHAAAVLRKFEDLT